MSRTEPYLDLTASFFEAGARLSAVIVSLALWLSAAVVDAAGPAVAAASATAAETAAAPAAAVEFTDFQDNAFLEARRSGSPLVLYFGAEWCAPCKKMHEQTFRSPAVLEAAAGYKWFRVDLTHSDSHLELVKKSFRVPGAPTVILFASNGQERARQFGFIPPEVFAKMLRESRTPPQGA